MPKAVWNGAVIAESDHTVVVEGNHYFPPGAVRRDLIQPSESTSICSWKGAASYYDVVAGGEVNPAAAWYYPDPKADARQITGYVAFWKGVQIEG
jgi:uncharacterized protein (DUF427 family)